jgi:AAA domain, putative AbiEii toxin, Type IV TA system
VRLDEVTSKEIVFRDASGARVPVEDLSDGYRSILSMTFELIRQLSLAFGADGLFAPDDNSRVIPSGVVLVDEIDVHLHPTWQRRIGQWYRKHVPNIQFIISTHSPLVCQSADKGSVFVLPRAGQSGRGRMLRGLELNRVLYGNVIDAYGTEAFGKGAATNRSPKAVRMQGRLAFLNNKEVTEGLTEAEASKQQQLRSAMPSEPTLLDSNDKIS